MCYFCRILHVCLHLMLCSVLFGGLVVQLCCNPVLIPLTNFLFAYRKRVIKMCLLSTLQNPDNNDHMAYWLSNASTLLFLLQVQRSLKASGAAGAAAQGKPPQPTSFFGRMAQVIIYLLNYSFFKQFVHEYDDI